jgi:signal peptidase I
MKKPTRKAATKPAAPATQPDENIFQSIASLCGPIIVGLFVLTFVLQNFVIPSRSMASTLLVGDHVVADRASLSPSTHWAPIPYRPLQHGEPVVFYKPVLESDGTGLTLVKRVIGLPGDRIHLRDGIVYLNGVAQNEPHAAKPPYATFDLYRDDFPAFPATKDPKVTAVWALDLPNHIQGDDLVVPPDCYFVMGDNRANSLDSRYWGFVHRDNLVGRPLFVYWSFDEPEQDGPEPPLSERAASTLHMLVHFFDGTRWSRTLHRIN